jgi:hypothetical protein
MNSILEIMTLVERYGNEMYQLGRDHEWGDYDAKDNENELKEQIRKAIEDYAQPLF